MTEVLQMENAHDDRGSVHRALRLEDDGSLVIEGHDFGRTVSDFWGGDGSSEYEFVRTLAPWAVAELRAAASLDDEPLLQSLKSRFRNTVALERFLIDHAIGTTFWSRVGD